MNAMIRLNIEYKSQHGVNELVNVFLSVSPVSSSLERVSLVSETSSWGSEFEWPEEVVGFLEMGTDS